MDSSPVNPYLLFESPNEFRSGDKVLYALNHPIGQKGARSLRKLSQLVDSHFIISSVEDLRRLVTLPLTPSTGTTFDGQFAYCSYTSKTASVPVFAEKTHGLSVEDTEDMESKPWENPHSGTSLWRWPIEVLYQRYHLLIAIDFSFSTFDVSRSGKVLIDYVPSAIGALLAVVKKTLQTREKEAELIKRWASMYVDEAEREYVIRQVWKPRIDVSVVLVNLPRLEMGALSSVSPEHLSFGSEGVIDVDSFYPHLFPVDATPFPTFDCGSPNDSTNSHSLIPLLTRCKAEFLLRDEDFLSRLEAMLRAYEEACRSRLLDVWPERTLFASLEHLFRLLPERSPDCTSLVLISNADIGASYDVFSLLESSVRRKNIILSLLFLSETVSIRDLHTSPLSLFLSSVGGFGVHLQYWFSLASPRLNTDWCRHFGGPRCLSQQLFVHLETKFPVRVANISRSILTVSADRGFDSCVLYKSDNVLEDFELCFEHDVHTLLRSVAEARLNQGWSVVMNYSLEIPHVAHIYARYHHTLRQGKLTIMYEMEISYPVVYRRVVVSGSKDLLHHFVKAKLEDRTGTTPFKETKRGWLIYLVIVRSQLDGWMRAEQVALQSLFLCQRSAEPLLLNELQGLSCCEGVSDWWLSHCSVCSVGFFFRWENGVLQFLDPRHGEQRTGVPSVAAIASHVLRAALKRRHRHFPHKKGDVFVSKCDEKNDLYYIVQVFILDDSPANSQEGSLAAGFECRFSFFLTTLSDELQVLTEVLADVEAEVVDTRKLGGFGGTTLALAVEASVNDANARALHVTLCTVLPRRLDAITTCSGLLSCGHRIIPGNVGGRRSMRPYSLLRVQTEKKTRIVKQRSIGCFSTPYLVSPWVLSDALAFHWVIGTAETWRTFAEPSFKIFVTRRVRDGFRLLHCFEQRKAILYASRLCGGSHAVDVFDVIEVPPEGGSGSLTTQVIIYRYIRPFQFAISSLYRPQLTADIAEDIQVATVLHTFAVLSSVPLAAAATDQLVPLREIGQGVLQLLPRLESLLPFLSARYAHTITLRSLPSMGEKGDDDLREAVGRFISSLGDRSATVDAKALHESMRQKLYGSDKSEESISEIAYEELKLLYVLLTPMECSSITFLLMPCIGNVTTAERDQGVNVYVLSLDVTSLYRGVLRLYGRSGEEEEVNGATSPDSLDPCLLNALFKLLTSFCSIYQAWRLLEKQCDSMGCQTVLEAGVAQDVLRTFSTFQDYWKEFDISHLLYVQESKMRSFDAGFFLQESLRSLIASMVRSMCLQPLPTHPAVFLPVSERPRETRGGILGESAAHDTLEDSASVYVTHQDLKTLPFLVKIALLFLSESGEEESCVWIFSPERSAEKNNDECESLWFPIDAEMPQRATRRLVMRFFVKTAPKQLVDLSCDKYNPPAGVIQRIFRELLRDGQKSEMLDMTTPPLFFAMESSVEELNTLCMRALPFDELPSAIHRFFDVIASDLTKGVACYCLTECLQSASFGSLRSLVTDKATSTTKADSLPIYSHDDDSIDIMSNTGEETTFLRFLAHESQEILNAALKIPGLKDLLAFAVSPALLSAPCFEADSFILEFTQHSSFSDAVNPAQALLDVFTRRLAEDCVCVVPATTSCFLFVPNSKYFASRWLLIYVTSNTCAETQRVSLLFNEHEEDPDVCRQLCRGIRRLIEAKVMEVNQLHLLKQLRDTQNANDELIPLHWGSQFSSSPTIFPVKTEYMTLPAVKFYCRGTTVLKIPIYYKLQHQCKKILSCITSNCSRLELINIYNREQCFVVADDVQTDMFHYIRLVFVKDTVHLPPLTAPSPPLSPADRCPLLVVQLFSVKKNALVQRPLRKLQDFCFFLAVQELQGHLNYVQHKLISEVDLIFLQYHRLDPVSVDLMDVGGGKSLQPTDIQLAFALVVLGLKENRFKYFQVRDERSPAVSNFAEHYGLLDGRGENSDVSSVTELGQHDLSFSLPTSILRFVRIIESATDALVSCSLRVASGSRLVVDRFLTKMLDERYTAGESETAYLKQIDDVVQDAVLQWRFFAISKCLGVLSFRQLVPAVGELLKCASDVRSNELSTLRFKSFLLDRINHAVFPFLIESLVGIFKPFSPVCFEVRPGTSPSHMIGFPWKWVEQMQRDFLTERVEVYLTCGYRIMLDDEEREQIAKETRAVCPTRQDLHVSGATVLVQSSLLRDHGIELGASTEPRVLAQISLVKGVTVALFNIRDSDIVLRLIEHFIAKAEQQSNLLHDTMLQRMGLTLPSYLTELALAELCCGDDSSVARQKRLCIYDETYRRRVNHVRFPVESSAGDDPYTIIVEGLFNRGLLVNGLFDKNNAIQVLYNECSQYSWKECRRIVEGLLRDGTFNMEDKASPCCLSNLNSIPDDALIGCAFRRHVQTAHILVESQHSRSGILESLQECGVRWHLKSLENDMVLAKSVILLQGRSKQIFGSRVPDFTLLRRERWCPSDDVLDQSLPPRGQPGSNYCVLVDKTLKSYVNFLQRLFPTARIIDLDANHTTVSSDTTLHHRFRCRYGKVVSPDGTVIRFVPHLYYVLIPIADTVKAMGWRDCDLSLTAPFTKGGFFIVEIGFQVAHFALDVFMVNGESLSATTAAHTAAWFKRNLTFSSVLYDLTVNRLFYCVQMYSTHISGELRTSDALENFVKYYPRPPHNSLNIVAVFDVGDFCTRKQRMLRMRKFSESSESSGVRYLIPKDEKQLFREVTREGYHYCGVIDLKSSRLFVLLSTVCDPTLSDRCPGGDLQKLALLAKDQLLQLLKTSTPEQRLELAWERIRTPLDGGGSNNDDDDDADHRPSREDLQILQTRRSKLTFTDFLEPFLRLQLDWTTLLKRCYGVISAALLPIFTLHLITDETVEHGATTASRTFDIITLTLAPRNLECESFTVVEFGGGPRGSIRSATLCSAAGERGVSDKLLEEEAELVEQTLKLLSSALWSMDNL